MKPGELVRWSEFGRDLRKVSRMGLIISIEAGPDQVRARILCADGGIRYLNGNLEVIG